MGKERELEQRIEVDDLVNRTLREAALGHWATGVVGLYDGDSLQAVLGYDASVELPPLEDEGRELSQPEQLHDSRWCV